RQQQQHRGPQEQTSHGMALRGERGDGTSVGYLRSNPNASAILEKGTQLATSVVPFLRRSNELGDHVRWPFFDRRPRVQTRRSASGLAAVSIASRTALSTLGS